MPVDVQDARTGSPARRLDPVVRAGSLACEAALVIMMLLITVEVVIRSAFNYSLQFTDELSGYLLVAVTFLSISISLRDGAVFRVDVLYRRFAAGIRAVLELVFQTLSLVFAVLLDYQVIRLVMSSYQREVTAPTLLATPLYVPQLVLPIGVTLMVLVLLAGVWEHLVTMFARDGRERGLA